MHITCVKKVGLNSLLLGCNTCISHLGIQITGIHENTYMKNYFISPILIRNLDCDCDSGGSDCRPVGGTVSADWRGHTVCVVDRACCRLHNLEYSVLLTIWYVYNT